MYFAFVIAEVIIVGIIPGTSYVAEDGTNYIRSELSTLIILLPFAINFGILFTKKALTSGKIKLARNNTTQIEQLQSLETHIASENPSIPQVLSANQSAAVDSVAGSYADTQNVETSATPEDRHISVERHTDYDSVVTFVGENEGISVSARLSTEDLASPIVTSDDHDIEEDDATDCEQVVAQDSELSRIIDMNDITPVQSTNRNALIALLGENIDNSLSPHLVEAIEAIFKGGQASASIIQCALNCDYVESTHIIDELERFRIISPYIGARPRFILVKSEDEAYRLCIMSITEEIARENERKDMEHKLRLLSEVGLAENLDLSDLDGMQVATALEENLNDAYREFFYGALPTDAGYIKFTQIEKACGSSIFPLASQNRVNALLEEYRHRFKNPNPLAVVDQMEGLEFEEWCANLLRKHGYTQVEVTKASGDQGVDVLAVKDEIRYAIQCKCYSANLGNTPVQEILAGKKMYRCQIGVVMTNRYFTPGAKELAETTGILLWDRDKLQHMIDTI